MVFLSISVCIFQTRMFQPKFKIQYIVVFWFMIVYDLVGWYHPTIGVYCFNLVDGYDMSFYLLNTVLTRRLQYMSHFGLLITKNKIIHPLQNLLKSSSTVAFISSFILLFPDDKVTYSWLIYKICHIFAHEISYKEIPPQCLIFRHAV